MEVSKIGVPLLIVNGGFRSLSTLSVEELENFIPFMTQYSAAKGKAAIVNGAPEWWLNPVKFNFPLKKPKGLSDMGYRRHLQSIVCRCYTYHKAHYLLAFSSRFSECPESIFLKSNENNTTSIFSLENTSVIFTFDNENKEYDKKLKEKQIKKILLPPESDKSEPHVIPDIYLCENCEFECYSMGDMKKHEKECYGTHIEEVSSDMLNISHNIPQSETSEIEFLRYLGLCSISELNINSTEKKDVVTSPNKRKILEQRFKRDIMAHTEKSILTYESYCKTKRTEQRINKNRCKSMKSVKRMCKEPEEQVWSHSYCFNKKQRMERMKTILTGLDRRSRILLKQCKNVRVVVQRLELPMDADFFTVSLKRGLIIPFKLSRDV